MPQRIIGAAFRVPAKHGRNTAPNLTVDSLELLGQPFNVCEPIPSAHEEIVTVVLDGECRHAAFVVTCRHDFGGYAFWEAASC